MEISLSLALMPANYSDWPAPALWQSLAHWQSAGEGPCQGLHYHLFYPPSKDEALFGTEKVADCQMLLITTSSGVPTKERACEPFVGQNRT